MKMGSLLAIQRILLINWIIAPALGICIWVKSGFFIAAVFVVIWLIADKLWDWLTELLISRVVRIRASEQEASQISMSGEIPKRITFIMIIDLLGTFILPWVVAGFFWIGISS